jgi:hypothetical protein
MLTNLLPNTYNFNPPKSNKTLSKNAKMLLDVAKTPIFPTKKRMGILLQVCNTYKWIHNQYLVNCCGCIHRNASQGNCYKCGFCRIQQHTMHDFCHSPPKKLSPMFSSNIFHYFQHLEQGFEAFKISH